MLYNEFPWQINDDGGAVVRRGRFAHVHGRGL